PGRQPFFGVSGVVRPDFDQRGAVPDHAADEEVRRPPRIPSRALLLRPRSHAVESATLSSILSIQGLSKTYAGGRQALKRIDLEIAKGEIFALLGPNGAGKTTLINIVCGIVTPTGGKVAVGGHDILTDYRAARSQIGLVPQELAMTPFESVMASVSFSRGLFGKSRNDAFVQKTLTSLALWDRRDSK